MNGLHHRSVTAWEFVGILILVGMVGGLFWLQEAAADSRHMDSSRKQDISAMYYFLENTYYPEHHGYPATLTATTLKGLDPTTLKDPHNKTVNTPSSSYTYLPAGCQEGVCSSYKLTATLQKEASFSKTSVVH
jgi:hypothetical protein